MNLSRNLFRKVNGDANLCVSEEIDKAVTENKTTAHYFFGVEEDIYYQLFDNPAVESRGSAFLSKEKSIAIRVWKVIEAQILECVSSDSCVVTKYYALMTLANAGLALCWAVEGGDRAKGIISRDELDIERLDYEAEQAPRRMMYVLLEDELPALLLRKMWAIYEDLTDDEIE